MRTRGSVGEIVGVATGDGVAVAGNGVAVAGDDVAVAGNGVAVAGDDVAVAVKVGTVPLEVSDGVGVGIVSLTDCAGLSPRSEASALE